MNTFIKDKLLVGAVGFLVGLLGSRIILYLAAVSRREELSVLLNHPLWSTLAICLASSVISIIISLFLQINSFKKS